MPAPLKIKNKNHEIRNEKVLMAFLILHLAFLLDLHFLISHFLFLIEQPPFIARKKI